MAEDRHRPMMLAGGPLHSQAPRLAEAFRSGRISRRDFLTQVTSLGVTASAAFALGGLAPPAQAAAEPVHGGRMRIAMVIREWKDPRNFDWSELANPSRQCNEHLVRWRRDFTFEAAFWKAGPSARTRANTC